LIGQPAPHHVDAAIAERADETHSVELCRRTHSTENGRTCPKDRVLCARESRMKPDAGGL
jgi:hypothetical protein